MFQIRRMISLPYNHGEQSNKENNLFSLPLPLSLSFSHHYYLVLLFFFSRTFQLFIFSFSSALVTFFWFPFPIPFSHDYPGLFFHYMKSFSAQASFFENSFSFSLNISSCPISFLLLFSLKFFGNRHLKKVHESFLLTLLWLTVEWALEAVLSSAFMSWLTLTMYVISLSLSLKPSLSISLSVFLSSFSSLTHFI